MKESKLFKGLLAAFATVALGTSALASADAKSELQGVAVKVSYADLDLEKYEGAKTLYRRLQQASRQVCGGRGLGGDRSISTLAETRRCYQEALSDAVAEIDNDLLTQLHNS